MSQSVIFKLKRYRDWESEITARTWCGVSLDRSTRKNKLGRKKLDGH